MARVVGMAGEIGCLGTMGYGVSKLGSWVGGVLHHCGFLGLLTGLKGVGGTKCARAGGRYSTVW